MKSVLILVLLAFSLCLLGGWKKRSINENSLEIDESFKLACSEFIKTKGGDQDDCIRLTVYSQVAGGMNYNITFIDSNAEFPTIQGYRIYKSVGNSNDNQFTIVEHEEFEATNGLIAPNDSKFTDLEINLYKLLKKSEEELNFISFVYPIEDYATNFFVISANTASGDHEYILCQDKDSEEYYSFAKLK